MYIRYIRSFYVVDVNVMKAVDYFWDW
jgi:hypothetical protein